MRKNQLKYVHHGYENDSCDKSVVINHVASLSGFKSHKHQKWLWPCKTSSDDVPNNFSGFRLFFSKKFKSQKNFFIF
jgi:hypothetical protein